MIDIKTDKAKYIAEAEDLKRKLSDLGQLRVPFWKPSLLKKLREQQGQLLLAIAERKGIIAFLNSKDGKVK